MTKILSNKIEDIKKVNEFISNHSLYLIEKNIDKKSKDTFIYNETDSLEKDIIYLKNLIRIRPNLNIIFKRKSTKSIIVNELLDLKPDVDKKIPIFSKDSQFFFYNFSLEKDFEKKKIEFKYKIDINEFKKSHLYPLVSEIKDNNIYFNKNDNILSLNKDNSSSKKIFNKEKNFFSFPENYDIYAPIIDISLFFITKKTTSIYNKKLISSSKDLIFINKENKKVLNNKMKELNSNALINPKLYKLSKSKTYYFKEVIRQKINKINSYKVGRYLYIELDRDFNNLSYIVDNLGQIFKCNKIKDLEKSSLYQLKLVI